MGACVAVGVHGGGWERGMYGRRGCVWHGACMAGGVHGGGGRGACMAEGGMHGGGRHASQGVWMACMPPSGQYYEIRSMSGQYTS